MSNENEGTVVDRTEAQALSIDVSALKEQIVSNAVSPKNDNRKALVWQQELYGCQEIQNIKTFITKGKTFNYDVNGDLKTGESANQRFVVQSDPEAGRIAMKAGPKVCAVAFLEDDNTIIMECGQYAPFGWHHANLCAIKNVCRLICRIGDVSTYLGRSGSDTWIEKFKIEYRKKN